MYLDLFTIEDRLARIKDFTQAYEMYDDNFKSEEPGSISSLRSSYIKTAFSDLGISITPDHILKMERLVIGFEIRGKHPEALNSPLLAVHPISFLDSDRSAFFDLWGYKESTIASVIKRIPSINKSFKVQSDPLNVLAVWVIHLAYVFIKNPTVRINFQINVAKYLHYRFFTSIVNHMFSHGAHEDIMVATIESLTKKYDIIVEGTWRRVIEARCRDLVDDSSIHIEAFRTADHDGKFLYVISDTQTRMRDKIKIIASTYYDYNEKGIRVESSSLVKEHEGEKYLAQSVSMLDTMITNVFSEVTSINKFINKPLIVAMVNQFGATSVPLLTNFLTQISSIATQQSMKKDLDKTIIINKGQPDEQEIVVGMRALVALIIQSSYRYCIKQGLSIKTNRAKLYVDIKNIHKSSRISDENIVKVKNSVSYLVKQYGKTTREATQASLRLAFIMYIIAKSMNY